MNNSRLLAFFIALPALLCAYRSHEKTGPTATLQPFEAVEPHMGTLFRIKLYAANQQAADQAFRAAFDRITELDGVLSDYKPESELNRASVTGRKGPVPVGADLFRVLAKSQSLARETQGAFDVTVGPLTHLWREARKRNEPPDTSAIEQAKAHCGYQRLALNETARTICWQGSGLQLDAGGIAKGYAADEALNIISAHGLASALVAASGDLAFSDAPPGERGWKVGIDSVDSAGAPFTRVLLLENSAVSTSGDTEQFLQVGSKRYSHILDPRTGMGLVKAPTVTVIARHGLDADPAATALSVLGCDKGMRYAEAHPELAVLMLADGRLLESKSFQQLRGMN